MHSIGNQFQLQRHCKLGLWPTTSLELSSLSCSWYHSCKRLQLMSPPPLHQQCFQKTVRNHNKNPEPYTLPTKQTSKRWSFILLTFCLFALWVGYRVLDSCYNFLHFFWLLYLSYWKAKMKLGGVHLRSATMCVWLLSNLQPSTFAKFARWWKFA